MDREDWRAAVYGVEKSQTWLSDWTELNWTESTQGKMWGQHGPHGSLLKRLLFLTTREKKI